MEREVLSDKLIFYQVPKKRQAMSQRKEYSRQKKQQVLELWSESMLGAFTKPMGVLCGLNGAAWAWRKWWQRGHC